MHKRNLYLICPDCHIEHTLRENFGQNAYFLTALGTVFDFSDLASAEALNGFIDSEIISDIIIVNDINCTFINNTISKQNSYETKADQILSELKKNNIDRFSSLNTDEQKELLARLNIYRQAYELLDVAFVGNKIDGGSINTSGLLYNRSNSQFKQLNLGV